jgi:hypothetical protein
LGLQVCPLTGDVDLETGLERSRAAAEDATTHLLLLFLPAR